MKKLHLQPPRGILLVGVPGCGKSMSAKAISASWKLSLYRLDFATGQGSYVGQSEQQLKDALTTAENVAPCILWIDEIEKGAFRCWFIQRWRGIYPYGGTVPLLAPGMQKIRICGSYSE